MANLATLVDPVIERKPKKPKPSPEEELGVQQKEEKKDPEDEDWMEVEKEKEELKLPGYSHGSSVSLTLLSAIAHYLTMSVNLIV